MATLIGNLTVCKTFEVSKARLLGSLPGYDDGVLRNVSIIFLEATPLSDEYLTSRWWLGITDNRRTETVPFQPVDKKVIHEGPQLQVHLTAKTDPKTSNRLSDLKVTDQNEEVLRQIKEFVLTRICGNETRSSTSNQPPVLNGGIQSRVALGGGGNYDDKENMSSGQSTASSNGSERQRAFTKQTFAGSLTGSGTPSGGPSAPASSKGVSSSQFYGKGSGGTQTSSYNWRYQGSPSVRPTPTMDALRDTYRTSSSSSSPPNPVGSQNRPIPNYSLRTESSMSKQTSKTPFTMFGAKVAKENNYNTSPFPSGRTNPIGSGPYASYRDSPFRKSSSTTKMNASLDQYDFENDENNSIDNDIRGITPIADNASSNEVSSTSVTTVARTRSSSPVGLLNLGNSCYMNAVLQALFAHPSFNYDLQRISEDDFIQVTSELLREKELQKGQTSMEMVSTANQRNKNASEASLILCVLSLLRSCSANPPDILDRQKARLLAVKAASKKFTDSQQHDAQEFLCCVLDDLKEEHRNGFTAVKSAECVFQSEEETNNAEVLVNPVSANFDFTLRKLLSCRQCDRVASEQVESFNNLSVHIPNAEASVAALQSKLQQHQEPKKSISAISNNNADDLDLPDFENVAPLENNSGNIINKASTSAQSSSDLDAVVVSPQPSPPAELSLQDCIDHFFQKEEIEYRSEVCGHDYGGVVSYCLGSLPRVFVIHLKRFLYTMTSNVGTKCTLPVTIPLELDLSKYCAQKGVQFPKLIDSPLAPKEALKSELLSPGKFSPSSSVPQRASKCRKRLLSDDESDKGDSAKNQCENDENVPISGAPKRSRSTTISDNIKGVEVNCGNITTSLAGAAVVPDSPHPEFSNDSSDHRNSSEFQQYTKYRLSAIISHTGSSSDYGHYTTDAYHSTLRKWFRFDDMTVKSINESNVLEENKWNGYIFFYTALPLFEQTVLNSSSLQTTTPSNNNFSKNV